MLICNVFHSSLCIFPDYLHNIKNGRLHVHLCWRTCNVFHCSYKCWCYIIDRFSLFKNVYVLRATCYTGVSPFIFVEEIRNRFVFNSSWKTGFLRATSLCFSCSLMALFILLVSPLFSLQHLERLACQISAHDLRCRFHSSCEFVMLNTTFSTLHVHFLLRICVSCSLFISFLVVLSQCFSLFM